MPALPPPHEHDDSRLPVDKVYAVMLVVMVGAWLWFLWRSDRRSAQSWNNLNDQAAAAFGAVPTVIDGEAVVIVGEPPASSNGSKPKTKAAAMPPPPPETTI